jgi:acyl carrier protein
MQGQPFDLLAEHLRSPVPRLPAPLPPIWETERGRGGRNAGVPLRAGFELEELAVQEEAIRSALAAHGRLAVDASEVGRDDDLYAAGLTSHATISVMLSLEDELGIEFPENALRKSTFASIAAIDEAIDEIMGAVPS